MALTGVAIVKETPFRDSVQQFTNVYYYKSLGTMGLGDAAAIVSYLVNREKPLHAPAVTFIKARVWSAGGTTAQNQMIHEEDLVGVGSGSTVGYMDRERAFLVQWPAGVDSRGHPVFLRKWYHACGTPFGVTIGDSQIANLTQLTAAAKTALQDLCAGIRSPDTLTESFELCSRTGRDAQGGPIAHPYIEHHQLGDMWRA